MQAAAVRVYLVCPSCNDTMTVLLSGTELQGPQISGAESVSNQAPLQAVVAAFMLDIWAPALQVFTALGTHLS